MNRSELPMNRSELRAAAETALRTGKATDYIALNDVAGPRPVLALLDRLEAAEALLWEAVGNPSITKRGGAAADSWRGSARAFLEDTQ